MMLWQRILKSRLNLEASEIVGYFRNISRIHVKSIFEL